jgi:purine-binding chemotaxis protein CheW
MVMREATIRVRQDRASNLVLDAQNAAMAPWLLFRAGTVLCVLPIEHIIESMRVLPRERIAGAPDYILGLSVIRGMPTPVVDVGRIICDRNIAPTRLVAIRSSIGTTALAVDAVLGIATIAPETLGQLPPLLETAATDRIMAVGTQDYELVLFLRAGRMVPDAVLDLLDVGSAVL